MALLTMATLTTVARACGHEAFRRIDSTLARVATVAARHARLRPAGLAATDAGVAPRLAGYGATPGRGACRAGTAWWLHCSVAVPRGWWPGQGLGLGARFRARVGVRVGVRTAR
eukprot:scaffold37859_cov50-Phaeocystis_antarctica.AAC.1